MSIEILTSTILSQMPKISKRNRDFFLHLMILLVSLRGRFNFMNLSRYGLFNEATYRQRFSKGFDFMGFNQDLITTHCSGERIIAFDRAANRPSYLPKSGKHTYGVGRFWSGSAQQVKKGLELSGFSCVDLKHWTALHLYAQQTVLQDGEELMGFYMNLLHQQAPQLLKISNILCVDAYFSKHNYVTTATACGFTLVSRLRNDGVLRYLYQGSKTGKRGRPKTYEGTVDKNHLRSEVFTSFQTQEGFTAYQGIVNIKSLQMNARVVILAQEGKNGTTKAPKVFFTTDLKMDGIEVLKVYKARFQCEFLYRDAKQHIGLQQAQCRSKEKLHYHLNASLTAVSVAKAAHYLNQENRQDYGFSMADSAVQLLRLTMSMNFCLSDLLPCLE